MRLSTVLPALAQEMAEAEPGRGLGIDQMDALGPGVTDTLD